MIKKILSSLIAATIVFHTPVIADDKKMSEWQLSVELKKTETDTCGKVHDGCCIEGGCHGGDCNLSNQW